MTGEELISVVTRARENGQTQVVLKLSRRAKGDRVRVLPGVMGKVVAWGDGTPKFPTVCFVKVDDLERAIKKAANAC